MIWWFNLFLICLFFLIFFIVFWYLFIFIFFIPHLYNYIYIYIHTNYIYIPIIYIQLYNDTYYIYIYLVYIHIPYNIYIYICNIFYTCINMYVYQVCFSMYRSYHICRRVWIWSEVAPGCQGITLQILSRLRQSYPNGPKELKSGILQQKYVFLTSKNFAEQFHMFHRSRKIWRSRCLASRVTVLARSLLSLLDLRFETGYPVGDPTLRVEDIGPVAFARAWLCYVFRSFLSSSALCSLFCRILTSMWKQMPWTELVLLRAMTSHNCFRFHCDCLIQLRMSMNQLYVVVHICTLYYTVFWQIALSHQLCLVFCWGSGCNIWCGRVTQCSRSSVEIQMSTRSSQISSEQTWTSGRRLDKFVLWLCRECWCFSSWRGKDGKGHPVETNFTMFPPCFTICRPCLYPGDGIHKASGLVKFEGNDKKNLLMVQQIQNGQNVEALTWWST